MRSSFRLVSSASDAEVVIFDVSDVEFTILDAGDERLPFVAAESDLFPRCRAVADGGHRHRTGCVRVDLHLGAVSHLAVAK